MAQMKDVEFILTSVVWNKFQISLCGSIFFYIAKLFFHFVQYVVIFNNIFILILHLERRVLL